MRGRRCGCERSSGGVCAEYISTAASSPAWFTRRAESRKSRCDCVSGRVGGVCSATAAWLEGMESCEGRATAAERADVEGCGAVFVGVLWMRAFWREADGMAHGARAWRMAGCRLRAAVRANEGLGSRAADML